MKRQLVLWICALALLLALPSAPAVATTPRAFASCTFNGGTYSDQFSCQSFSTPDPPYSNSELAELAAFAGNAASPKACANGYMTAEDTHVENVTVASHTDFDGYYDCRIETPSVSASAAPGQSPPLR